MKKLVLAILVLMSLAITSQAREWNGRYYEGSKVYKLDATDRARIYGRILAAAKYSYQFEFNGWSEKYENVKAYSNPMANGGGKYLQVAFCNVGYEQHLGTSLGHAYTVPYGSFKFNSFRMDVIQDLFYNKTHIDIYQVGAENNFQFILK